MRLAEGPLRAAPPPPLELTADPDRERADRAFAAMLQMKKIDIAQLYRAADQT